MSDIEYSITWVFLGEGVTSNFEEILDIDSERADDWRLEFLVAIMTDESEKLRVNKFCIYYVGDDNRDLNFKFFDLTGFNFTYTNGGNEVTRAEGVHKTEINEKSDIYNRCKALFKFKAGVKSTLSSFEYRAIIQGYLEKNKDTLQKEVIIDFINNKLSCGETHRCILIIDTLDHVSAALLEPIGTGNDNNLIVKGIFFDSTCEHCENKDGKIVPNTQLVKILGEDICNNLDCINVAHYVDKGIDTYEANTLQIGGTCTELMTSFVCTASLLVNGELLDGERNPTQKFVDKFYETLSELGGVGCLNVEGLNIFCNSYNLESPGHKCPKWKRSLNSRIRKKKGDSSDDEYHEPSKQKKLDQVGQI